ncbi:unnamed protein product [Bursaphelenchus xylophilus]|uniref:(pine wood nematode) hypothetical protein n=1 Tax=Bursaphelenchus xylophilus TaxID=6326 RepID=A0A1I7SLN3_BURXY|nr:unnamed protein product [Bursaphelenchus xylophilus]CAG9129680.1 unnamed protein product [Bursaphelenchus xylophilus]
MLPIITMLFVLLGLVRAQPWLSPDFPVRLIDDTIDHMTSRLLPEATVCRYCLCDRHTLTVTCASAKLRLKTLILPQWAEIFHAYNVSVPEFPHFTYHPGLKVLRINNCHLKHLHPLSFIPLPNLETVHLTDNEISSLPETLFRRLVHLRIINLARNKINNLDDLEWSLPEGLILEQLHLDGNPIKLGKSESSIHSWPRTRQLNLANANVMHVNSTHVIFQDSPLCLQEACRALRLSPKVWEVMHSLDLSENSKIHLHPSAFESLTNLSSLRLAGCPLSDNILTWLDSPTNRIRHLDLNDARFELQIKEWRFCAPSLEWLDISGIGISSLKVQPKCSNLQWLYAERNNLERAEIKSHSLVGIHLRGNKLQIWPLPIGQDALPFSRLTYLSLSDNLMDTVPPHALHSLPQLEILDLSNNRLTSLPRSAMPTMELKLRSLNVSDNFLEEFKPPILPSLAVLDLSSNNLNMIDNDFWISLPLLQRLHLAGNPPQMLVDWESTAIRHSTQLMELDLSNMGLHEIPVLSQLKHLRSLRLDSNKISFLDGSRLPKCLMSLSSRGNFIHLLGNFSEDQFSCLKEMDLARNPLKCDCSLALLSPILEHQAGYTDRSEYYCFSDNWQHPLRAYVESARFCQDQSDEDRFTPLLLNFMGILTVFIVLAGLAVFLMFRFCAVLSKRVMPFAYKPVLQSDLIVDL